MSTLTSQGYILKGLYGLAAVVTLIVSPLLMTSSGPIIIVAILDII